jgi:hypothetical protein
MAVGPVCRYLAYHRFHFLYTDDSKKGGSAATQPATDTRVKVLVHSNPPYHTIKRAELAGINIGMQP